MRVPKIPTYAHDQITSMQDFTIEMIEQIQETAYDQNLKKYVDTCDVVSSAELAADIPVQSMVNLMKHAKLTIMGIVLNHYEEDYNDAMTMEQISIVVVGSLQQVKEIAKPYLGTDKSFNFYR